VSGTWSSAHTDGFDAAGAERRNSAIPFAGLAFASTGRRRRG